MAVTFDNIDGEESATVTFRVAAVKIARGSTDELQEILTLGDPQTSNALARITAAQPASTEFALLTRIVSGPSSVADLAVRAVLSSTNTDNPVTATPNSTAFVKNAGWSVDSSNALNVKLDGSTALTIGAVAAGAGRLNIGSTAADNAVTATPNSTAFVKTAGWSVDSSNALNVKLDGSTALTIGSIAAGAGRLNIGSTATDNAVLFPTTQSVQVKNSTIGDLLASVQQNSTVWQVQAKIQDSSGVGPNIVGTRPSTGAQAFAVRTVLNDLQSTFLSTFGNNSTSSTIASSQAGLRHKVYAYSITSTVQAVNSLIWASSLGNPIWGVQMQSMSSGITGVNLAVTPPAWLFATEASNPLVLKVTGSTGTYHVSASWFTEA